MAAVARVAASAAAVVGWTRKKRKDATRSGPSGYVSLFRLVRSGHPPPTHTHTHTLASLLRQGEACQDRSSPKTKLGNAETTSSSSPSPSGMCMCVGEAGGKVHPLHHLAGGRRAHTHTHATHLPLFPPPTRTPSSPPLTFINRHARTHTHTNLSSSPTGSACVSLSSVSPPPSPSAATHTHTYLWADACSHLIPCAQCRTLASALVLFIFGHTHAHAPPVNTPSPTSSHH